MQAHWQGQYLYLYSGRNIQEKNADMTKVGKEDPFAKVQCIRIDSITSVDVYHTQFTITLWIGQRPIHCSFGDRNCHKINCHAAFLTVLAEALHFNAQFVWGMDRRNSETALSVQRGDTRYDEDSE